MLELTVSTAMSFLEESRLPRAMIRRMETSGIICNDETSMSDIDRVSYGVGVFEIYPFRAS
jgi:hypothetical protein